MSYGKQKQVDLSEQLNCAVKFILINKNHTALAFIKIMKNFTLIKCCHKNILMFLLEK